MPLFSTRVGLRHLRPHERTSFAVFPGDVQEAVQELFKAAEEQRPYKISIVGWVLDTGDGKHIPGAEISTYLARHGVSAEARHAISSSDLAASDALLSEIADHGANLLVMGGYGHHRMREVLLGGVTRDILRQMTVPVLMSH